MSERHPGEPPALDMRRQQSIEDMLKLAVKKPRAPVAYSEALGYIEIPVSVLEYCDEPGALGVTGATFGLESNYTPGLREKALKALVEARLISKPLLKDATDLKISWVGLASEAANRIRQEHKK